MCYTWICKYENYFKGYLTKEEIQTLIDDEVLDYDDLKFYGYDLDELDDDEDNDEVEQWL